MSKDSRNTGESSGFLRRNLPTVREQLAPESDLVTPPPDTSTLPLAQSDSDEVLAPRHLEGSTDPDATVGQRPGLRPVSLERETLQVWLSAIGQPPIVIQSQNQPLLVTLRAAAEARGFRVVAVESAVAAYQRALEQLPLAFICDEKLPDASSALFLATIRGDYRLHDIPFLVVPSGSTASNLDDGRLISAVMSSLERAVAPRVRFYRQVQQGRNEALGRLSPMGVVDLLRDANCLRLSGQLLLRSAPSRKAKVSISAGEVVSVDLYDQVQSSGLHALVEVIALQWSEFLFVSGEDDAGLSALSPFESLLSASCGFNNALLTRMYEQGIASEGIYVDRRMLDHYLHNVPPTTLDWLLPLARGERPRELVNGDKTLPAQLRFMLQGLRRHGAVRVQTLAEDDLVSEVPTTERKRSGQSRVGIALLAAAITVAAGALVFWLLG